MLERIASVRSDWSVETQSSAMFARPSPPSTCGFAAHLLDRPGGDGLASSLASFPGPREGGEKGLVSTVCACAKSRWNSTGTVDI